MLACADASPTFYISIFHFPVQYLSNALSFCNPAVCSVSDAAKHNPQSHQFYNGTRIVQCEYIESGFQQWSVRAFELLHALHCAMLRQ